jgi:DNA-binding MarR family transcriptional regulator
MQKVPDRRMLGLDREPGFDPARFVATSLTALAHVESRFAAELERRGLPPLRDAHALLWLGDGRIHRRPVGLLAADVGLSPSAATRLVERLEAARLVRRERGRPDRRESWVVLEPEGLVVVRRIRRAAATVVRGTVLATADVPQLERVQAVLARLGPPGR